MDVTTVFSRGNKLTIAICVTIIVIGLAINIVVARFASSSDSLRVEQVRLAEYKAQVGLTPGLLSAMQLSPNPTEASVAVAQHLNVLHAKAISGNLRIEQAFVSNYSQAVSQEIKATLVRDFGDPDQIRQSKTMPAFRNLNANIDKQLLEYNRQAVELRQKGQVWKIVAFVITALLFLMTVVAFQIISHADARKDEERRSQKINGLRFAAVVQNSSDIILLTSRKGVITLVNEACVPAWGLNPKSCVGKQVLTLFSSSDSSDMLRAFEEALANPNDDIGASIRIEVRPGIHHFFQVHIRNLLNNVHIGGLLFTFHDITERAAVEEALTHQATHDRLTGLPNRSQVMSRISEAILRTKSTGQVVGALFIDLDNFKNINDTLGHEMGDLLLIEVAKRIQGTVRPSDMAARLGGDEFVVLLDNAGGAETGETIAKRIADQFARPYNLGGKEVSVTASIGIALSQDSDEESNDLLRRADTAMYEAKRQGKSGYVVFNSSLKMQPESDQDMTSEVQRAIREKSFELQFQPIESLSDQTIREVEALVRWQHPTTGLISSQKLFSKLEDSQLMSEVGDWVLAELCWKLKEWPIGADGLTVTVNVSRQLFFQENFAISVETKLKETGIEPHQIKFEISESDLLSDLEHSRRVCNSLRSFGIHVAIDEFGCGQSSMDYLNGFPVDAIKIDRLIIDQLGEDASSDRIVRAIIEAAHTAKMTVTGEGIETAEQLTILRELRCDFGQGSLLARPMSSDEMAIRLAQGKSIPIGQVL